jgi:hypothetical protein
MMTANDLYDFFQTEGMDRNCSIISEVFNILRMTIARRPSPTFFIGKFHSDVTVSA